MESKTLYPTYKLAIVAFVSGAVVMAMELTGSRLAAPFLGSSIYVWTSIIGVILASLSVGYVLGGYLGDSAPNKLPTVLILAATSLLFLEASEFYILASVQKANLDIRYGALVAALFLFFVPSLLLGCITPCCTRIALASISTSGRTIGSLYAISTFGSIVGTFLTGFYLFSLLGSSELLLLLGAVLSLLPPLLDLRKTILPSLLLWIVLVFLFYTHSVRMERAKEKGLSVIDTRYHRVMVVDEQMKDGRTRRSLITDPFGAQSQMYLDSPNSLSGEYSQFYDIGVYNSSASGHYLLLGGGAYTYPKYFAKQFPEATLDIVEIDPELLPLAEQYFQYEKSARHTIHHVDARRFLERSNDTYDSIFVDVFSSAPEIPAHVITEEFFSIARSRLNPNGQLIINLISAVDGPASKILDAVVATLETVFRKTSIFSVDSERKTSDIQNVLIIAGDVDVDWLRMPSEIAALRDRRHKASTGIVLRDEYAPVESLMLPVYHALYRNQTTDKNQQK